MQKKSLIYIAGHAGFIGTALMKKLKEYGYSNLIFKTDRELDLTSQPETNRFFKKFRPEYVFLLAAKVGGILANSKYPAEFLYQNVMIQNNVINAAYKYNVKKLLFPGSACMYPKYCPQPIKAEHLLTGYIEPTNEAFAIAKICGIKMCQAYNKQYRTKFICAVPATVYGPGDHFDINGHVVASLIERFFRAKLSGKPKVVEVWGTGKPMREFIYVDDAADAFIFLMNKYEGSNIVHIGTKEVVSMKQLAVMLKDIIGFQGKIKFNPKRPDGIPKRVLDTHKIFSLGWKPKISLSEGLKLTCEWYNSRL